MSEEVEILSKQIQQNLDEVEKHIALVRWHLKQIQIQLEKK